MENNIRGSDYFNKRLINKIYLVIEDKSLSDFLNENLFGVFLGVLGVLIISSTFS